MLGDKSIVVDFSNTLIETNIIFSNILKLLTGIDVATVAPAKKNKLDKLIRFITIFNLSDYFNFNYRKVVIDEQEYEYPSHSLVTFVIRYLQELDIDPYFKVNNGIDYDEFYEIVKDELYMDLDNHMVSTYEPILNTVSGGAKYELFVTSNHMLIKYSGIKKDEESIEYNESAEKLAEITKLVNCNDKTRELWMRILEINDLERENRLMKEQLKREQLLQASAMFSPDLNNVNHHPVSHYNMPMSINNLVKPRVIEHKPLAVMIEPKRGGYNPSDEDIRGLLDAVFKRMNAKQK